MKELFCSQCNIKLTGGKEKVSLPLYSLVDGRFYPKPEKFFPVMPYFCKQCGKVEFYHAELELINS